MEQNFYPVIIDSNNENKRIAITQSAKYNKLLSEFGNPGRKGVVTKADREERKQKIADEFIETPLLDQSWLGNRRCAAVASKLYKNPSRLYWVGDDSRLYDKLVGETYEYGFTEEEGRFDVTGRFAVNHTKKEYFRFSDAPKYEDGDVMFALSILTALGGTLGFLEYKGLWAGDIISVEDEVPNGYELLDISFLAD